jgi:group I intron endonuclease
LVNGKELIKINNYIVYEHKNKINNKRYIGITCRSVQKRWQNGKGYIANEHFYRAIIKYGWEEFEHNILFCFFSKKEAEEKEIYLIKKYKSNDYNFGYNIQEGGFSSKHSQKTKNKISFANKGIKNGMYGKVVSEETKQKLRYKNLGEKNPMFGKIQTEEIKYKKILGSKKRKIILKLDLFNNLICEYPSARQTAIKNNTDHKTIIKHCINNKQFNNFIFKYKSGY